VHNLHIITLYKLSCVSSVSSLAFQQARHSQNAWAQHIEHFVLRRDEPSGILAIVVLWTANDRQLQKISVINLRLRLNWCIFCMWVCMWLEGAAASADPEDMLDRQRCLDALAAVRRVKWFHVRSRNLIVRVSVLQIYRNSCFLSCCTLLLLEMGKFGETWMPL